MVNTSEVVGSENEGNGETKTAPSSSETEVKSGEIEGDKGATIAASSYTENEANCGESVGQQNGEQNYEEVSNRTDGVGNNGNGVDVQAVDDDSNMNTETTWGQEKGTNVSENRIVDDVEMEDSTLSQNISMDQEDSMPLRSENSGIIDSDGDEASETGEVPAKKRKINDAGIAAIKHYQTLKKTGQSFLQHKPCDKVKGFQIGKCMECKLAKNPSGRKGKDAICRFYSFRKLKYNTVGTLIKAGFPNASTDYSQPELDLWLPVKPPEDMSVELAQYLLEEVGDQFCDLVKQEKQTLDFLSEQTEKEIIWRKTVRNLRELCDVCSTTLFNYHWTCGRCGFVVCVSCFASRKKPHVQGDSHHPLANADRLGNRRDEYGWLRCHIGEHDLKDLLLTQIIAGKAMEELSLKVHELRKRLDITQRCGCDLAYLDSIAPLATNELKEDKEDKSSLKKEELVEAEKEKVEDTEAKGSDDDEDDQDGLMDLFGGDDSETEENDEKGDDNDSKQDSTNGKNPVKESSSSNSSFVASKLEPQLTNFVRKGGSSNYTIKVVPKRTLSTAESTRLYPNVEHKWLCRGNLLRLMEPTNPHNFKIFQEQWRRGQPVLVSNVASKLNPDLWTPESFSQDFGHKTNPLINCMTGKTVLNKKIKVFWDGFEHMKKRLRDEKGEPMLLKLKDWPPGADFAEISPNRFQDLMKALPLGEYTYRNGMLNLAARLPEMFSRPDLGPKMYIAYGSGLHLDKGTTNLHLDISDAVNVMVYVGGVKDEDVTAHTKAVEEAIEESDCDTATIKRVSDKEDFPGALWHIWEASDADKIRDLLNKISFERGERVERHHDSIHDQTWYLDRTLRRRLMEEYNVIGYPIVQCAGDAVFIPAGAPHQVRNLNNCIKIAEDFVSPENVGHCFYLTEEFRNLTDTHSNHEDKLQIKNIVYHTIKDAVAVILKSLQVTTA